MREQSMHLAVQSTEESNGTEPEWVVTGGRKKTRIFSLDTCFFVAHRGKNTEKKTQVAQPSGSHDESSIPET